jgi:hypothetical protein
LSERTLPDGFGRAYRQAVFEGRPRSAPALILAHVLLDEAYARRSTVVELGYALLRDVTMLHGRSLDRGRDWLVERGLLLVRSTPRVRTEWVLVPPPSLTAPTRTGEVSDLTAPTRTDSDRTSDRTSDRAHADAHSLSHSYSPLSPPKGGQEDSENDLRQAVHPRRRRDRRSAAEVIADAVARAEAEDGE